MYRDIVPSLHMYRRRFSKSMTAVVPRGRNVGDAPCPRWLGVPLFCAAASRNAVKLAFAAGSQSTRNHTRRQRDGATRRKYEI